MKVSGEFVMFIPPEVRRLASRISSIEQTLKAGASTPRLGSSSLEDEAIDIHDADGELVGRVGAQADGTYGAVSLGGPTPPTPSAPTVAGGPGQVTVVWDGTFEGGGEAPLDFLVTEVWAATDDFTTTDGARLLGHYANPAGGEVTGALPVGTWHVGLVTRTQSGQRSLVSARVTADVESVVDQAVIDDLNAKLADMPSITWAESAPTLVDGDDKPVGAVWRHVNPSGQIVGEWEWDGAVWESRPISGEAIYSLELGKLTAAFSQLDEVVANQIFADIFTANQVTAQNIDTQSLGVDTGFIGVLNSATIVGAVIKTAASGMRVELSSGHGIRIFDTAGNVIFNIDTTMGEMEMTGRIKYRVGDLEMSIGPMQGPLVNETFPGMRWHDVTSGDVPELAPGVFPFDGGVMLSASGGGGFTTRSRVIVRPPMGGNLGQVRMSALGGVIIDGSSLVAQQGVNVFATAAERDAALPNAPAGTEATVGGIKYIRSSSGWAQIWPAPDTGWVSLTGLFNTGFSGDILARKVDGDVEIAVDVTGTFGAGTANFLRAVPAQYRPTTGMNGWGPAYFNGGHSGTLWCRPDGTMAAGHQTGASRTRVQGSVRFFA